MSFQVQSGRPSLPESYAIPRIWDTDHNSVNAVFGGMNRSTARPRSERALPVGKHAIQLYSTGTPNGQKITTFLEELGIEYDAWNIRPLSRYRYGRSGMASVGMRFFAIPKRRKMISWGSFCVSVAVCQCLRSTSTV